MMHTSYPSNTQAFQVLLYYIMVVCVNVCVCLCVFLGGMSNEGQAYSIYSEWVTQGLKVIPATQLKRAGSCIGQRQYRKVLEVDGHFCDNDKGTKSYCVGEGNNKPLL